MPWMRGRGIENRRRGAIDSAPPRRSRWERMEKATAVLIRWRRHREVEEIARALRATRWIDEVLIHDNTECNLMSYGHFVTARKARNALVYVQDDDCLVDGVD